MRGSHAQEVVEPGWHDLKTFGAGKELRFEEWMEYGAQLINGGYVTVAYDRGQSLQLTALSGPVLKGERAVPLVKYRSPEEKKAAPAPKAAATTDGDPDLFDHLRAVRKKIADEHEVPAYVVFSDKTLKDMAAKVPKTPAEFRQVHGVGEAKLEAYGTIFLRAIEDWQGKKP